MIALPPDSTCSGKFWASSCGFRLIERRERHDDVSALHPAPVHHRCGIRLRGGDGILGDLRSTELISSQPYPEEIIQRASPGADGGRGLEAGLGLVDSTLACAKSKRRTLCNGDVRHS